MVNATKVGASCSWGRQYVSPIHSLDPTSTSCSIRVNLQAEPKIRVEFRAPFISSNMVKSPHLAVLGLGECGVDVMWPGLYYFMSVIGD